MGKIFPAARSCDSCKSAEAVLFCRTDSACLCVGCDARLHRASSSAAGCEAKHERVWMCEVCEQAPASFTCRADAAALCVTCDRDIHSANPLARRHERLPVAAFYDSAESILLLKSSAAGEHESEPESRWVLPDPNGKICSGTLDMKSVELLFSDNDKFLDFDNYPFSLQNYGSDSVVPVQQQIKSINPTPPPMMNPPGQADNYFEIDFSNPNSSYTAQSLSHSVSSSSLDVGVVSEGSSMSDISYPFGKNFGSVSDLGGSANPVPAQGTDREARVMRYREKRKNRRFEKTIRYASRKAYAETRPRIKGRFAKRTEVDPDEMDRIFVSRSPAALLADVGGYGVVPSF